MTRARAVLAAVAFANLIVASLLVAIACLAAIPAARAARVPTLA